MRTPTDIELLFEKPRDSPIGLDMKLLPWINSILLAGILASLIIIVRHLPPTLAEVKDAGSDKAALLLRRPIVHAETNLSEPLEVEVQNTVDVSEPVEVTITR